ncbi:MAG: hypothetical protein JWN48_5763 [Myxococcaceae bacterium]|nr:hypothetical protein [Myxococcaceae bacterium]
MNELLRAAILGTGQLPASTAEQTDTAVDALVAQLSELERERAFLLRAGGLALLRRAALRCEAPAPSRVEPAAAETLAAASARLTEVLATLLSETDAALLGEACERMAHARLRLPEELLPAALSKSGAELQTRMRPVLGARGLWLSATRPEWTWARSAAAPDAVLPADAEARWEEASVAERKRMLALARRTQPGLARSFFVGSWKQEKAEQRLAWLELLATDLTEDDEALLDAARNDRSSQVRVAAARLSWRLPHSALATRVRAHVETLLSYRAPAAGLLAKLKSLAGAETHGSWHVELPDETFTSAWEQDGIVETAPQGIGRRQWWFGQLLSAVPPEHWAALYRVAPETLLAAARAHEHGELLLDGLTAAALRHGSASWNAPLWDAWITSAPKAFVSPRSREALSARLTRAEAEPRMLKLLDSGTELELLAYFPSPWPHAVATRVLLELRSYRPTVAPLLAVAAMAIPAELLPTDLPSPQVPENDYAAQNYLRALERFRSIASVRRVIAEETAP